MEWTRTETLALAAQKCTHCHGVGMRPGRGNTSTPCNCTLRGIFRACYNRFRQCLEEQHGVGKMRLDFDVKRMRRTFWRGRKNEEFTADFYLISKRTLTEEEFRIFKYHFLLGADYNLCCRKLKITKGDFFHPVYRIEQKLGREFRELTPYPLFPIDEYFNGVTEREGEGEKATNVLRMPPRRQSLADRVPVKVAA